jgi:hypothetical protein
LQVGQSRRVENTRIETLRCAGYSASRRGWGRFAVAPEADGQMRIWRIEYVFVPR